MQSALVAERHASESCVAAFARADTILRHGFNASWNTNVDFGDLGTKTEWNVVENFDFNVTISTILDFQRDLGFDEKLQRRSPDAADFELFGFRKPRIIPGPGEHERRVPCQHREKIAGIGPTRPNPKESNEQKQKEAPAKGRGNATGDFPARASRRRNKMRSRTHRGTSTALITSRTT